MEVSEIPIDLVVTSIRLIVDTLRSRAFTNPSCLVQSLQQFWLENGDVTDVEFRQAFL